MKRLLRLTILSVLLLAHTFMVSAFTTLVGGARRSPFLHLVKAKNLYQHQTSRLMASASNSDDNSTKWEKMYVDTTTSFSSSDKYAASTLKNEVRVVSFDLDNTIWKTSLVIGSANDALADHMINLGIDKSIRVEKVMGQLFKSDKAKYCPVSADDIKNDDEKNNLDRIKAPTLLTELRKDAVMEVLSGQTIEFDQKLEVLVDEAFLVWTTARHDSIPLNFALSVLECLDRIRNLKTSDGRPIVVGAITDGNSDPRKVKELEKYFDFVVNAEGVGISKPDKRIYEAAIELVKEDEKLNHVFENPCNTDSLREIGPWWIHVGDDFVKDIVACKDLNMRSIWSTELVKEKLVSSAPKESVEKERTVEDLRKDLSEKKVLTMPMGGDDYILNSITTEFADATVENFVEVGQQIALWHSEGIEVGNENDSPEQPKSAMPGDKVISSSLVTDESEQATNLKFCVMCGEQLPSEAKFCSKCGNKQ